VQGHVGRGRVGEGGRADGVAAGNKQFFSEVGQDGLHRKKFKTVGNVVSVMTALTLAAYVSLLVLTLKLAS
jgi:hypothetical protein